MPVHMVIIPEEEWQKFKQRAQSLSREVGFKISVSELVRKLALEQLEKGKNGG